MYVRVRVLTLHDRVLLRGQMNGEFSQRLGLTSHCEWHEHHEISKLAQIRIRSLFACFHGKGCLLTCPI